MPFAERLLHGVAIIALVAAASGCATLPAGKGAAGDSSAVEVLGSDRKVPTVAAAPSTAATAVAATPVPEIPAEARRAFGAATQALAEGRTEEAERGFLALTESNPELGGPYANLGLIYRRSGRLEQAAEQFERAVRASPQRAVYLNQLGVTYRELGRFAEAQKAYEKAIELEPEYAAPRLNLGILLDLYLWDRTGALAAYERYLALADEDDDKVRKWVADIRNRKPQPQLVGMRERP